MQESVGDGDATYVTSTASGPGVVAAILVKGCKVIADCHGSTMQTDFDI